MAQRAKTQRLQIRIHNIENGWTRQKKGDSPWLKTNHTQSTNFPGCKPAPDTAEVHRELDPSATCKCVFLMWPGCFQHLGFIDCSPALLAACTFHNAPACNMASNFSPRIKSSCASTLAIQQLCGPTPFWGRTQCIPYGLRGCQAYMKPWNCSSLKSCVAWTQLLSLSRKPNPCFEWWTHSIKQPWNAPSGVVVLRKHHDSTEIPGSSK